MNFVWAKIPYHVLKLACRFTKPPFWVHEKLFNRYPITELLSRIFRRSDTNFCKCILKFLLPFLAHRHRNAIIHFNVVF